MGYMLPNGGVGVMASMTPWAGVDGSSESLSAERSARGLVSTSGGGEQLV